MTEQSPQQPESAPADTKPRYPVSPIADADPGLRIDQKLVRLPNGELRVVRRDIDEEMGRRATRLPRLTY